MALFLLLLLHSAYSRYCEGKDKSYNIGDKINLCFYLETVEYDKNNSLSVQDFNNILSVELKVDVFSGVRLNSSYKDIIESECTQRFRFLNDTTDDNNSTDSTNSTDNNGTDSSDSSNSNPDSSDSSDNSDTSNCLLYKGIAVAYSKTKYSVFSPFIKDNYVGGAYSVVVTLKGGKVKKIEWDNFCDICDDKCIKFDDEEICATKMCKAGSLGDCDPRIYVTWIGTDGNDENLVSASYRISQFRKYSIFKMYSQARDKF